MSIDIEKFVTLVNTMSAVGVTQAVIEPSDEGSLVRACSDDRNIVVFSEIEDSFCDKPIGITKLSALQSRLALFDLEKASISFKEHEDHVRDIVIKEGRRKASYRCCRIRDVSAPNRLANFDVPEGEPVSFSSEFVSYLSSVVSAISLTGNKDQRKIGMSCTGGELNIRVEDGDSDSFDATETVEGVEDFDSHQWNVKAFVKTMKHCSDLDKDKNASFYVIPEIGICYFMSSPVDYLLAPEIN